MIIKTFDKKTRKFVFTYDIIDDSTIIDIFTFDKKRLQLMHLTKTWLQEHLDLKKYLDNRYKDSHNYKEIIYRICNNIEDHPLCPICGKLQKFNNFSKGYYKHCSTQCAMKDQSTKENRKNACTIKYGFPNAIQSPEIQKKSLETLLLNYGVDNAAKADTVKEKIRSTCNDRYGVNSPSQYIDFIEKQKQTCLNRYGVTTFLNTSICREKSSSQKSYKKSIETKKKNKTLNTSKIEIEFKDYLDKTFPNDYVYQYYSSLYPFNCDFYIISLDIYIEIQGSWTHGLHQFNQNSEDDIKILNKWKEKNTDYFKNAIDTWTIRDVKKRSVAKQNNLNYLEIFSIDINQCIKQLNDFIFSLNKYKNI